MRFHLIATALALFSGSTFPAYADTLPTAADLSASGAFQKSYHAMIRLPRWVETGRATSSPVTRVEIEGRPYLLGHMCKPHDCAAEQLDVAFARDGKQAWGLLSIQSGTHMRQILLGEPSPAITSALDDAYKSNNPSD